MNFETRVYKFFLELFPRTVREHHGAGMVETYQDALRDAKANGFPETVEFHKRTVWDTLAENIAVIRNMAKPSLSARAAAVLGVLYGLGLIASLFTRIVPYNLQVIVHTLFLLFWFLSSQQRPFSELFFTGLGAFVQGLAFINHLILWQYYFEFTGQYAESANPWLLVSNILSWSFWGLSGVAILLRSLEQQRPSRLLFGWLPITTISIAHLVIPNFYSPIWAEIWFVIPTLLVALLHFFVSFKLLQRSKYQKFNASIATSA
jgi:hypothetical protein